MRHLIFILLLTACGSEVLAPALDVYEMELDARLEQNADGFYLLDVVDNGSQTIHRVSGHVTKNGEALQNQRVVWESSHYWTIGDSLRMLIRRDNCIASTASNTSCILVVNLETRQDTVYLSQFSGQEVPTVNGVSLSAADGEINTIFAPIYGMRGDTVDITAIALFPTDNVTQIVQIILR